MFVVLLITDDCCLTIGVIIHTNKWICILYYFQFYKYMDELNKSITGIYKELCKYYSTVPSKTMLLIGFSD